MLAALMAGLLLLGACIPEARAVGTGVITVSAKDLYAAYARDEAAADAKYKGRRLEVTGEVIISRVVVLIDQYCIVLNGEIDPTFTSWGIQCLFNKTSDTRLYEAEKHRIVTVRGRCDGLQQDVVLRDCELVSLQPK